MLKCFMNADRGVYMRPIAFPETQLGEQTVQTREDSVTRGRTGH